MHVSYEAQVLLVSRRLTDRLSPFFNRLQDLVLHATGSDGRSFRKPSDKLVQEFFGADLEVEWISAVFDADIQERQCQERHVGIPVIDELDDGDSGFSRCISFLGVYQVNDLEVQGQVRLEVGNRVAGIVNESLQCRPRGGEAVELIPRRHSCRSGFHGTRRKSRTGGQMYPDHAVGDRVATLG